MLSKSLKSKAKKLGLKLRVKKKSGGSYEKSKKQLENQVKHRENMKKKSSKHVRKSRFGQQLWRQGEGSYANGMVGALYPSDMYMNLPARYPLGNVSMMKYPYV